MWRYKKVIKPFLCYALITIVSSFFRGKQLDFSALYSNIWQFFLILFIFFYIFAQIKSYPYNLYRYEHIRSYRIAQFREFTLLNAILMIYIFILNCILMIMFSENDLNLQLAYPYLLNLFLIFEVAFLFSLIKVSFSQYTLRLYFIFFGLFLLYIIAKLTDGTAIAALNLVFYFLNNSFSLSSFVHYAAWMVIPICFMDRKETEL